MATSSAYVPEACKAKYTDSQGLPVRCQGVGCEDKWQHKNRNRLTVIPEINGAVSK